MWLLQVEQWDSEWRIEHFTELIYSVTKQNLDGKTEDGTKRDVEDVNNSDNILDKDLPERIKNIWVAKYFILSFEGFYK